MFNHTCIIHCTWFPSRGSGAQLMWLWLSLSSNRRREELMELSTTNGHINIDYIFINPVFFSCGASSVCEWKLGSMSGFLYFGSCWPPPSCYFLDVLWMTCEYVWTHTCIKTFPHVLQAVPPSLSSCTPPRSPRTVALSPPFTPAPCWTETWGEFQIWVSLVFSAWGWFSNVNIISETSVCFLKWMTDNNFSQYSSLTKFLPLNILTKHLSEWRCVVKKYLLLILLL